MIFKGRTFEPHPADVAAAEASLTNEPFLPDNLDIIVFYGAHGSRQDFNKLQPYIADADIFIPELTAWDLRTVGLFSRIAQGDKGARSELEANVEGRRFTGFTDAETRALLGSNLHITPIDYAEHHDRAQEIQDHFDNWTLLKLVVPKFNKTLYKIGQYAQKEAELDEYREKIMAQSIGPRLEALIANSPELAEQDRVRVLIQQGTAHTFFYHELSRMVAKNGTCTVSRVFDKPKPIVFEHFDRLARAFRANVKLTNEQKRELEMRALARTALKLSAIPLVIHETDGRGFKLRLPPAETMVERFGEDSIRAFHQSIVVGMREKG